MLTPDDVPLTAVDQPSEVNTSRSSLASVRVVQTNRGVSPADTHARGKGEVPPARGNLEVAAETVDGPATVETYSVRYDWPVRTGIIVGRLDADGDPPAAHIVVTSTEQGNRARLA